MILAHLPPPPPTHLQQAYVQTNPLLVSSADALCFDQIELQHFFPAIGQILEHLKEELASFTFSPDLSCHEFINYVERLQAPADRLSYLFGLFQGTMDSPEVRIISPTLFSSLLEAQELVAKHPAIMEYVTHFKSPKLFERLQPVHQRIIDLMHKDLRIQGAFLKKHEKEQFNALKKELNSLSTTFAANIKDSMKAGSLILHDQEQTKGIPYSDLKRAADSYQKKYPEAAVSVEKGPWLFPLSYANGYMLMRYAQDRGVRKQVFTNLNHIGTADFDNRSIVKSILEKRQQLAILLGFEDYNAMSLYSKMAHEKKHIEMLFAPLKERALNAYKKEREELIAFAKEKGFEGELAPWDTSYYSRVLSEELFDIDDQELKAYFPLEHVKDTLFSFTENLFGVEIKQSSRPSWHEDVTFYEMSNAQGEKIASFFMDNFARIGTKSPGAWMAIFSSLWEDGDNKHLPLTYLATNFTPPSEDEPTLLSLREVTTLFHEFGHTLQHLLTKQSYHTISGLNNIEWDGVEVASQFLESWVFYKPLLKKLSSHYKTGQPLDEAIMKRLIEREQFMSGHLLTRQLCFAELDLALHSRDNNASVDETFSSILSLQERPIHLLELNLPYRFSHLFAGGYAAGYYSYLYARIMAADLFAAFKEEGLTEASIERLGLLYKETFLELGGSQSPEKVFKLFRGRAASSEALIEELGL
jgi:oligopeptidase A